MRGTSWSYTTHDISSCQTGRRKPGSNVNVIKYCNKSVRAHGPKTRALFLSKLQRRYFIQQKNSTSTREILLSSQSLL